MAWSILSLPAILTITHLHSEVPYTHGEFCDYSQAMNESPIASIDLWYLKLLTIEILWCLHHMVHQLSMHGWIATMTICLLHWYQCYALVNCNHILLLSSNTALSLLNSAHFIVALPSEFTHWHPSHKLGLFSVLKLQPYSWQSSMLQ